MVVLMTFHHYEDSMTIVKQCKGKVKTNSYRWSPMYGSEPNKQTITQCWINVGPPSEKLDYYYPNSGSRLVLAGTCHFNNVPMLDQYRSASRTLTQHSLNIFIVSILASVIWGYFITKP